MANLGAYIPYMDPMRMEGTCFIVQGSFKQKNLPKGDFELRNPSWTCFSLTDSDPMGTYITPLNSPPFAGRFFLDVLQGTLESNLRELNFRSFRCSEIPQEVQVLDPKYFPPWPKSHQLGK